MERAYEELNRFSWNQEELLTYEQAEKYEWAYHASMAQKFDERIEKGKAEGEKIGIEKGRTEGEKAAFIRIENVNSGSSL